MKIVILDEAEQDLVDGFGFYESQSVGLGDYFLDSIFKDIKSLNIYAGVHALYFGYHRFLTKRFPFAVYYRIESQIVRVYAILDCRRNPSWIWNRLKCQ